MKNILIAILVFISTLCYSQTPMHLYGGKDHDVYLGCINCNNLSSASIWNTYGKYGSSYQTNSIWNSYGSYGSAYSNYSPFNAYASYPPVVVDKDGGFYGYFTVSTTKDKRADFSLALIIYKNYEKIREDVSEWYKKIFEN